MVPAVLLDGYVRVSQVAGRAGESFISPAVQREQIEGWASLHGATIGEVFEELDESGSRPDRPKLMQAIGRAESGETQGIVVAKLDRFGRSLVDGLANIERLTDAGAIFVSVQDGLDLSTPTGKLVMRIMLSMAEWELDRIRENWSVARGRAVARGVFPTAAPFGYRRRPDGRLEPDGPRARMVTELFRRRAANATLRSLLHLLDRSGLETVRGRSVVEGSLRGILANRVYLGEVRSGPHLNTSAHPPLVDHATWQLAQSPLRPRSGRQTSLLGGVLRCASCRRKMSVESGVHRHGTRGSVYRCSPRTSAGLCPAPARLRGEEVDGLVEDLVLREIATGRTDPTAARRIEAADGRLRSAEAALERYRDRSGAVTVLSPESFALGLASRQSAVEAAAVALGAAARSGGPPALHDPGICSRWVELDIAARREIVEGHIDCLFVSPGTAAVTDRVRVCRRGRAPADLPRRGMPIGEVRPFDRAECRSEALRRPPRWSPRRIEAELVGWRGTEDRWPTYVEFLQGGRARLHHQVLGYGGVNYWARRLGWRLPARTTRWDEEAIADGLRPILAGGRTMWPSRREFEAMGLEGLRRAVIRHGGITHWSKVCGLEARPGSRDRRPATDPVPDPGA
jgi:DNA invertase Pin-like site-specific DNA recombinase